MRLGAAPLFFEPADVKIESPGIMYIRVLTH
jgi:hypothetical protein